MLKPSMITLLPLQNMLAQPLKTANNLSFYTVNDNHFIYTILLLVIKNTLLNIVRSYANMTLTVMDTTFRIFNNDA
jgi:hypothetical protein